MATDPKTTPAGRDALAARGQEIIAEVDLVWQAYQQLCPTGRELFGALRMAQRGGERPGLDPVAVAQMEAVRGR